MMKRLFILGTMFKLFFLTSVTTALPVAEGGEKTAVNIETSGIEVNVIHLTDETFKKMIFDYEKNKEWKYAGTKPAIIDFYADWCAPCRQLSPVVEQVAKEYSGKIIVYKVDTDKEKNLARNIGITALPTLIFIPVKGQPQVSTGVLSKEALKKAINDVLAVK